MTWSQDDQSSLPVKVVSKTRVVPDKKSRIGDLKLSVSDLPMLSCQYIQKGCLFTISDAYDIPTIESFAHSLRLALSIFPPLAGTLSTTINGEVYLLCTDSGADLIHATAPTLSVTHLATPTPLLRKLLFPFDNTLSFSGHSLPLLAVQFTLLSDGLFLACSLNHAVADGTSFWHFFNTFAQSHHANSNYATIQPPDFSRTSVLVSNTAVLKLPKGGPSLTFSNHSPLSERIFSFSSSAILRLKDTANLHLNSMTTNAEILGKQAHDTFKHTTISSFQSVCALLWRAVTRARKLPDWKTTTFRMAVNCRHRLRPKMDQYYFGNAIQSVATSADAGDVLSLGLQWCALQLNASVRAHDDSAVRRMVAVWEKEPRCFPLGNPDGASITMGSSPRFPMYDNDFGWGRPVAVLSGPANKFDGKISAFPGRDGSGSVDLEVVLSTETMAALEGDAEFMSYVSTTTSA